MIQLDTPAKINLTLDILKKTPSGYHEIRSIMMPISLFDRVTIRLIAKPKHPLGTKNRGISLKTSGIASPKGEKNIVHQAATLFFKTIKKDPQITIHLHKNIPICAGLGGGSSDAAATLTILNQLYDKPLSKKQLTILATQIGMEVPFFLEPQLALVTHFGEKITPIKRPTLQQERPLGTKEHPVIMLSFQKTKKRSTKNQYETLNLALCGKQKSKTAKLLKFLKTSRKSWDPSWNPLLHNDFEQLYENNNSVKHLSGSGPAKFSIT